MREKRQKEQRSKSYLKSFKNRKGTDDGFYPVYEFKKEQKDESRSNRLHR